MLKEERWKLRFENFEKAFQKLSTIVHKENLDEYEQMALIQAFEFTFELAWKTMKDFLIAEGFEIKSPREAIRQAYDSEYIKNSDLWMDAIDVRNESVHAYDADILENTTKFIIDLFYLVAENFYNDFKIRMKE